jgi:molybdopterin-guanine dinucleotide biosynthesis protein A
MGTPKAWLPFDDELMLPRVVRLVGEAVGPVVVVAAPGQDLPALPPDVLVVRDEVEDRGALGGLATGLAALEGTTDLVYLSSCDVPLLKLEFVRRVVGLLGGSKEPRNAENVKMGKRSTWNILQTEGETPLAVVPRVGDRLHPLAAAYRLSILPVVRAMLAADRLRMTELFDRVPTRIVESHEFADIDSELLSLRNLNTPDEYADALRELRTS